jgi:hypothetical protein
MPNTIATPTWVLKEVGRGWINNIVFVKNCDRQYSDEYVQAGAKVGDTIKYRMPQRFNVTEGQALQLQALYDATVPISLQKQLNVAFSYSSAQATTDIDDVRERYVLPAARALANKADVVAFENTYKDVWNAVGTPGVAPTNQFTYLEGGVKLTDFSAEQESRVALLEPYAMAVLANNTSTLFNPQAYISEVFEEGLYARGALGFGKWFQSQNCPTFTTGTFTASTPIVSGANQTGSSLLTTGWASGATALKRGDIFVIAGVYSVNRTSYQSTNRLQQFVSKTDVNDTTGTITFSIDPPIITSGALQTVSNSPAASAAITVLGSTGAVAGTLATTTTRQGMLFVPQAFAFVTADLIKPEGGAEVDRVRSPEYGIALRMVQQYQILTDQNPRRIDMLVGAATPRPEWAVRVMS